MKRVQTFCVIHILAGCMMTFHAGAQTTTSEASSSFRPSVFVASTPCGEFVRSLYRIPASAACQLIRWHLTLYQNPHTFMPTTFKMISIYGLPKQGTNELINGGIQVEITGKWTIVKGMKTNPEAVVYQLTPDDAQSAVSFLKVDDNLLHLLSPDKSLMIGNAAWSYTLNKTKD